MARRLISARKLLDRVRQLGRRLAGCESLLVLGDSHARIFEHPRVRCSLRFYSIEVIAVKGATASGLKNPNSQTQAYSIFERALRATRAKTVLVLLGEVDTGFVIWHRAQRYGESVTAMLERAVTTCSDFLGELQDQGFRVVCISAPLPTIRNGDQRGKVANARREVKASQRERTNLTLAFNSRMEKFCRRRGIASRNLDPLCVAEDGLVQERLLNPNPLNHHYDPEAYVDLLLDQVVPLLEKSGRPASHSSA